MRHWWAIWLLLSGIWGFAVGGTLVAALHDQKQDQRKHSASDESKKQEPWWSLLPYWWRYLPSDANFYIAIFSGCLVATAFYQNRALLRANAVAKTAADAAEMTATAARHQMRAYVHVIDVTMDGMNDVDAPTVRVKFKNYGQTPAYAVENRCRPTLVFKGQPKTRFDETFTRYADLGPGQDRTTSTFIAGDLWTRMSRTAIDAKVGTIYVVGQIKYFDAFQDRNVDRPRFTNYQFVVNGIDDAGKASIAFSKEGNDSN